VVYYGFDPENPNARFSAPNKLFEALAAGKPLITGDFGEIGETVRRHSCGIVLPAYTVATVREAIEALKNRALWNECARNAGRLGQSEMNWSKGEEILYREYSALAPRREKRFGSAVHGSKRRQKDSLEAIDSGRHR
jgi:glycosyltransferase involved in cell wall biosynthesis